MTEALPSEEPSVLISAKALRALVDFVTMGNVSMDLENSIEEAESALERYK